MSQDLLSEFDSFYSAPVPPKPPTPIQNLSNPPPLQPSPPANRRFASVGPLNIDPPAPRQQLPLHNVPLVRTSSHTHQHRASATNFDDLLAYVNNPQAPWPPKPPQVTRLGQAQRPVSFHGPLPSSKKIDLFEALGNDFSGSDGRGGRFTPPPPRPISRSDYSAARGTTPVPQQQVGGAGVSGFCGFSTPTPPPDLLDMLDNEQNGDGDDDDFGDFASAFPAPKPASVLVLTPAPATTTAASTSNLQSSTSSTPRNSFSGIPTYGNGLHNSMRTLPPASMSGFSFPSTANHIPRDSFPGLQQNGDALRNTMGPPPASKSGFGFPLTTNNTPPRNSFSGTSHNEDSHRKSMGAPPAPPTPPKANNRIKKVSVPTLVDDDDFGEFMTSPVTSTPHSRSTVDTPPTRTFSTPPPAALPNTNRNTITLKNFAPPHPPAPKKKVDEDPIPPVSVLLTAFPPLFLLPQTNLLDKLTPLAFPLRQRVLSHPRTHEFLEGTCELGRVAGRIIAGRKRRTKFALPSSHNRAGSRGSGGMKLGAGSNSSWEQQKEDREVKEICRLWSDGAGRLKAAMRAGVPELVDKVGRGGPGVKVAGGCRLCGLGKGEIILGLKEQTERMGWWDAGWGGHGGCRGFWETHGKSLRG